MHSINTFQKVYEYYKQNVGSVIKVGNNAITLSE